MLYDFLTPLPVEGPEDELFMSSVLLDIAYIDALENIERCGGCGGCETGVTPLSSCVYSE